MTDYASSSKRNIALAVFHLGWLKSLVGPERLLTAIPLQVPMTVFCLNFGLSMDYKLFLLSLAGRRNWYPGGA
jgi:hypothetical protein